MTKQNEIVRNLKNLEKSVANLRDMYADESGARRHDRYIAAFKIFMFARDFMDELESVPAPRAEETSADSRRSLFFYQDM